MCGTCQNGSQDADVMITYAYDLPNEGMVVGISKREPIVNRLTPSKNLSNCLRFTEPHRKELRTLEMSVSKHAIKHEILQLLTLMLMKLALHSFAMALAGMVLPVLGGP